MNNATLHYLTIAGLQIPPGIPVERLIDELFTSTPGRLVFLVMILAIISIPVQTFGFLIILRRVSASDSAAQDKLVGVVDKMQTYSSELQEKNSENYLTIKTQMEQLSAIFGNITTGLSATQTTQNSIMGALADLVLQSTTQHTQTRVDIQGFFKNELQLALEEILDQRRLDLFDSFSPPPPDDCRFKVRLVRAALQTENPSESDKDILLYKAPIFRNNNEAGRLRGSGEIVRIIEHTSFGGWSYIRSMLPDDDPDKQTAGYARTRSLLISELKENQPTPPAG